ncbi:MAG: DUF3999 family protein [Calditrichia bacterium]
MKMKTKNNFYLLLLLFTSFAFGQAENYSYSREVKGIENLWHSIVLPNEVFRAISPSLSDIRIFGKTVKGEIVEAPYLLRAAADKVVNTDINFKQLNTSSNSRGHFFTFEVPENTDMNQLQLELEQQNFDWKVELEGSQDQREWFSIVKDYRIVSIKNQLTSYRFSTISFPKAQYRFLRLRIPSSEKTLLTSAKITQHQTIAGDYRNYPIRSMERSEDKVRKQTIVNIALSSRVPATRLKIDIQDDFDYYRPITIEYLADSVKTEKGWKYSWRSLTSGTLTSIEPNNFYFNHILFRKLRIHISNQDNQPLSIGSVSVTGPVYDLIVRFTESAAYHLTYGNAKATRPQYDIARFKENVPQDVSEVTLGVERELAKASNPEVEPLFGNPLWLWGIMLVVIGLLGWFSLKMLKNEG